MPPRACRRRAGLSGRGRLRRERLSPVWQCGRFDLRRVRLRHVDVDGSRPRVCPFGLRGSAMARSGTVRTLLAPDHPQRPTPATEVHRLRQSLPRRHLCSRSSPSAKSDARTELHDLWQALRAEAQPCHALFVSLSTESVSGPHRFQAGREPAAARESLGPNRQLAPLALSLATASAFCSRTSVAQAWSSSCIDLHLWMRAAIFLISRCGCSTVREPPAVSPGTASIFGRDYQADCPNSSHHKADGRSAFPTVEKAPCPRVPSTLGNHERYRMPPSGPKDGR